MHVRVCECKSANHCVKGLLWAPWPFAAVANDASVECSARMHWCVQLRQRVLTAAVASGVTSRGAGPVPPVVTTRQQPCLSHCERAMQLRGWQAVGPMTTSGLPSHQVLQGDLDDILFVGY